MAKTVTITLSDEDYEALQQAASRAHVSPEALATSTVADHLPRQPARPQQPEQPEQPALTPEQRARNELLAFLRDHGYVTDPRTTPQHTDAAADREALRRLDEIMRARGHLSDPQALPKPCHRIQARQTFPQPERQSGKSLSRNSMTSWARRSHSRASTSSILSSGDD